jgi:hypothetical protein
VSNKSQNPISLPENLRQKFAALERRLWRVETTAAVCVGLIGLLGAFAILFFLDRFVETPSALRAALLVVAIAVMAFAAMRWSFRWIILRRDWRTLSLIVQKKFRRLGDRLLGVVELSSESKHDANYSPELYRAAIQQVADETAPFDFSEAVEMRSAKTLIIVTTGLALLVLIPFLLVPALGENVFHRLVAPLAAVPRYTLVQLELPEKIIVPHGENFALNGTVKFRSFWKPSRAVARFETQNPVAAEVNGDKIAFQIPAQIQDGKLRVKVGDATRDVAVVPTYRPALKEISASIQLPEYLQAPPTNQAIHNGVLTLLEGSKFSLRGKVSRELASAEARFGESIQSLKTEKDEFESSVFDSHPQDAGATPAIQYAFNWRDNFGLSSASPWKLTVRMQKDLAPAPGLPDLPSDVAMLDTDVLEIRAQARDDYGVRDLGLSWDYQTDSLHPQGSMTTEVKIQPKSRHQKNVEKNFRWSPAIYRIPADSSVEIKAFAGDYFPERERAESQAHRIHVLGKEQHAELIRQRLESLLARVEEVARLEEKIMANTRDVNDDEKLTEKQKSERLGKASEDQERNAKVLEQLAAEGLKALQEALKNSIFSEQSLQEWAKNLQNMENLSQKEMKAAGENLKSAQQNSDSKSRKKDLAEAMKKEQEILEALKKMQGKVNKDLDDLQALTLAERLRKVGTTETDISAELKKVIPETIGLLPKELPEKFKKVGAALSDRQGEIHTESQELQKEINRFFERTQKPNYGEVSKEIAEAKTVEELERVGFLIKDNVGMEATKNLGEWSDRFAKWAEKLEPPQQESSGGSGSGSGQQQSKDMTKILVALLRLRSNEITLREQTRLLDEHRGDKANYEEQAGTLSEKQTQLGKILDDLAKLSDEPSLDKPYQQAGDSMTEVETLLKKPQTDKATLDAQVKTVDLLTDLVNLINEQAKRQSPKPQQGEGENQSTAEQMAFLMQMMSQPGKPGDAMTTNPSGGGNRSGGQTDRAGENFNGDGSGNSGESRRVQKATGVGNISLPAEFRETLENYFKAIEQETN